MRGSSASTPLVALAVGLLGWAVPAAEHIIVVRDGSSFSVPVEQVRGFPAARADSLAGALGYTCVGHSILMDGESVRFTPGSPFFTDGDNIYQLPNPVYVSGPRLMIPLSWALEWLAEARPRRWSYMDGRLVQRPPVTVQPPERESWLVVIDPGHGGRDPGTIGVGGAREKDVTLAIAKQLANRLRRERGVEVMLTRDRDTLIALGDRPRIPQLRGRDAAPDLFLSIHANAMPRKPHSARGFESYFLAIARTDEALQVALRENASLEYEDSNVNADRDPLLFMLSDLQSTANLRESRLLATAVNRSMATNLSVPDLGVKQGPFQVLVGATMPAVLVEVGYLSNRSEERQLRSSSYQAKIADALADAVVDYLADYGRRVWSSYSSGG
ncbi:MAG: N-acetylmuramoyl-L-alanine amidase [Gemmatimonadota bacterium]|nr:MAG: N-acetylmuramoyl-L-alanine amidase [Gemmatimonadota bacterium]